MNSIFQHSFPKYAVSLQGIYSIPTLLLGPEPLAAVSALELEVVAPLEPEEQLPELPLILD
jgi:hypothetical protein